MRAKALKGYERPLTYLCFNRDGDLFFAASKADYASVWRSATGERLGTYDGHKGAILSMDVTPDSKLLLTGSGDQTCRLWEVQNGRCLFVFDHEATVAGVAWAEGDRQFATINDPFGTDVPAAVNIYDLADDPSSQSATPRLRIVDEERPRVRMTRVAWLPLNRGLLVTDDQGFATVYDPESGERQMRWRAHEDRITSFTFNAEKTLLLTGSMDRAAKLWDVATWDLVYSYANDVPVNSVAISPFRDHVFLCVGQEAMKVTTTSTSSGKFGTRIVHTVWGEELARITGHFGTVNAIALSSDGKTFISGGEDGYIRVHWLDHEYDALGKSAEDEIEDPDLATMLEDGTYERLQDEEAAAARRADAEAAAAAAAQAAVRPR